MRRFFVSGVILMTLIILVPSLLVLGFSRDDSVLIYATKTKNSSAEESVINEVLDVEQTVVSVFRSQQERIEEVAFEDYIVGVVAREMPASFQLEALKAQALTART